jgi:hypothetical protein
MNALLAIPVQPGGIFSFNQTQIPKTASSTQENRRKRVSEGQSDNTEAETRLKRTRNNQSRLKF